MKTNWGTGTDMTRGVSISLVVILAGAISSAAVGEDYYLYKPEKVQTQKIPTPGEGVLTKTITIHRGDTLSKLSRKFSGRSAFFPQILLFNRINNPDLIYTGAQLRVPLSRPVAMSGEAEEENYREAETKKPSVRKHLKKHGKLTTPAPASNDRAELRLYKRGVSAFAAGHYHKALNIFNEFLATYPNSPDAAEAALYQAECYMKLSGE
jgi:LysM repeat protein